MRSLWSVTRRTGRVVLMAAAALLVSACASTSYPPAPPAASTEDYNYIIGAGDSVNIIVWRNPELSMTVPVRPDGKLTTPLVDEIPAQGKTSVELARDIEKLLAKFVRDPVVTVIVTWLDACAEPGVAGKQPVDGLVRDTSDDTVLVPPDVLFPQDGGDAADSAGAGGGGDDGGGADEPAEPDVLTVDVFEETLQAKSSDVSDCYAKAKEAKPDLSGKLSLDFTVGGDGVITEVKADPNSTIKDDGLNACVLEKAKGWKFPKTRDGEPMTLAYTYSMG